MHRSWQIRTDVQRQPHIRGESAVFLRTSGGGKKIRGYEKAKNLTGEIFKKTYRVPALYIRKEEEKNAEESGSKRDLSRPCVVKGEK